ncbi:MAG: prepilin-type N-terminal cleavage/methylation domain-containing protein [Planctomycetes bacterium]|nr:prepilin-type N-terminal cleavage/methylation domain-containing protein [Planctomycetota bacterium]
MRSDWLPCCGGPTSSLPSSSSSSLVLVLDSSPRQAKRIEDEGRGRGTRTIGAERRLCRHFGTALASNRRGFTLIELAAVILALAIVAAVAVLRLEGPLRRARMGDVVDLVAAFDRLARDYAMTHDRPVWLVVDVPQRRLRRASGEDGADLGAPLALPQGYRVAQVWLRGQPRSHARTAIPCSQHGLTPTYGLLIEGPAGRRQWLVVAGLSGQSMQVQDEREARTILDSAAARPHAG